MQLQDKFKMVVDSLQLVAADADDQVGAVPDFTSPTDEVATTFGDAYLLVPQLVRSGLIIKEAAAAMRILDEWFSQMPADGSVTETSTLTEHPFWREARSLARKALGIMGIPRRQPKQSHIAWIEGGQPE